MDGAVPSSCLQPAYRLPWRFKAPFVASVAVGQRRSFARDAALVVAGLRPAIEVVGSEYVPARGPCLVVCNHYYRPGFASWWLTFSIQAALAARRAPDADREIHWVTAAAWTYPPGSWRDRVETPLSAWAFRRMARVYGFVTMPPMPPRPFEVEARAVAVLRTVRLARRLAGTGGMIGLAPQGADVVDPLEPTPRGAGEFIFLVCKAGLPLLPVAVVEIDGRLRLSFGPVFVPRVPASRQERDAAVSEEVMAAIGRQLPARAA